MPLRHAAFRFFRRFSCHNGYASHVGVTLGVNVLHADSRRKMLRSPPSVRDCA